MRQQKSLEILISPIQRQFFLANGNRVFYTGIHLYFISDKCCCKIHQYTHVIPFLIIQQLPYWDTFVLLERKQIELLRN